MARRDWIRVRSAWWGDPAHAGLSCFALLIGPFLMYIADDDPNWRDTGAAYLLLPSGGPMSAHDLAKLCHGRTRDVQKALTSLVDVGTMHVRDDGAYGFPKYRKHQEDPSAYRQRKRRGVTHVSRDSHAPCHAPVTQVSREKREERREKRDDVGSTSSSTDSRIKRAATIATIEGTREEADRAVSSLLSELDTIRRKVEEQTGVSIGWLSQAHGTGDALKRAVAEVGTDTVRAVVEHAAREAAAKKIPRAYFQGLFRGDGFQARLSAWREAQERESRVETKQKQRRAATEDDAAQHEADEERRAKLVSSLANGCLPKPGWME